MENNLSNVETPLNAKEKESKRKALYYQANRDKILKRNKATNAKKIMCPLCNIEMLKIYKLRHDKTSHHLALVAKYCETAIHKGVVVDLTKMPQQEVGDELIIVPDFCFDEEDD